MKRYLLPLLLAVSFFSEAQVPLIGGKGKYIIQSAVNQPTQLSAPSLGLAVINPTQINVTVGTVAGAVSYELEFSLLAGGTYTALSQVSGVYAHTGLAPSTNYYYRARAIGDGTNNSTSPYVFGSTATSASVQLSAPTISTTVLSTSAIDITVGSVANASSYTLEFSTSPTGTFNPLSTSSGVYHQTGLTQGTTYYYRAKSVGDGVFFTNSGYATTNATTNSPTQLLAPTLSTTVLSTTAIDVTVGTVSGASSYNLDYSTSSSGPWTPLATSAGTYHHTGLTEATQYYYRTRAVGNGTTTLTSSYTTVGVQTNANVTPTQLTNPSLSATTISSSAIDVTVGSVANASSYVLEWSANGTTGWNQISTTAGLYHHTGLASSATYYYRARAIGNGTTFATSGNSTANATTTAATVTLSAPTLSASPASPSQINVTVGTVAGAVSYVLEWSPNGSTSWTQLTTASGVYNHTSLTPSTTYYYRARAIGNGTTTLTSNNATTQATTTAGGSFSPLVVGWMSKGGIANDGTVYHAGTPQEVTGAQYWNAGNTLAQSFSPSIRSRLYAVYVAAGETERSNSVNIIDTANYTLTHPNGYSYNGYGHKRGNASQYATPSGFNVLAITGNAYDFYIGGYSASTDFFVKAYQTEDYSLRLEDLGGLLYFDAPSTANRLITGDAAGRVNWLDGNLNGTSAVVQREGATILSGSSNVGGRMPDAAFQIFSNGVWSACVLGHSLTQLQKDTIRTAIELYLTTLNKTITPNPEWGSPSNLVVDNTLKSATFQRNSESVALTDYEASFDGQATWIQLSDSFARINTSTEFGWGGVNDGTMSIYVGNRNVSASNILVRVKARNGRGASTPIVANANVTFSSNYDRYMPGDLHYDADPSHKFGKFVWFAPAMGAFTEQTGYQYTLDGGATNMDAKSMSLFTENMNLAPGQFGVRLVSNYSGHYDGTNGKWIPDSILSGWRFNTEPYTSTPLTTLNITGLKTFDASVKATTTAGNNVITLTNNNYNFQVGDRIIVGLDGTGTPGHGLKGTRGFLNWPLLRFATRAEADAAASNPTYIDGQYAWIENDEVEPQYSGFVRRMNSSRVWQLYWPGSVTKEKAYAACFYDVITAVNGNQITVAHAPTITGTNASVYYDNCTKINQQLAGITNFTRVVFPRGVWHGSDAISVVQKTGIYFEMAGVTLQSIDNERPFSLNIQGVQSFHLNDQAVAGDSLKINSNYAYNKTSPMIARNGEVYNPDMMPVRDEFIASGGAYGRDAVYLEAKAVRARNIAVTDAKPPSIHLLLTDEVVDGWSIRYTQLMPQSYQDFPSAPPYPDGYYWAAYNEGKGNIFKNGKFWSPKWVNAIENFRATDNQFININVTNGHSSFNTSQGCAFINVHFWHDSAIRYTQGTGTPVVEMNDNFKDNTRSIRKNELNNVHIHLPYSIMNQAGVFPRGYLFNGTGQGVKMRLCSYDRHDIDEIFPGWYGQGFLGKGEGLDIDSLTITGAFGAGVQENQISLEKPSSLSITSLDGVPVDCNVKNVRAPLIWSPAGVNYINVAGTQLPFYPYPAITFAANPISEAGDSIHIQSIVTGTTASPADNSSINWQTWIIPEESGCNESDPNCWAKNKVAYLNRNTISPTAYNLLRDGRYQFRFQIANSQGVINFAYVDAYHAHEPPPLIAGSFIDKVKKAADTAKLLAVINLGSNEHDLQRVGNKWYWFTDNKGSVELRVADYVTGNPNKPYNGIEDLVNSDVTQLADNNTGGVAYQQGFPYGQARFPTWQYDSNHVWHLWGLMDNIRVVHMKDAISPYNLMAHPIINDQRTEYGMSHYDWNVRKNVTGSGYTAYYVADGNTATPIKIRWSRNANSDLETWAEQLPLGKHVWTNGGLSIHNILEDADPCQFYNPFDGKWYLFCGMWDGKKQRLGVAEIYPPDFVGNYPDGSPKAGTAKTPPYMFRDPVLNWETTYGLPRIFNPIPVWIDATHIIIVYSKNSDASGTGDGQINYGPQGTGVIGPIQMNYILPLLLFGFKRNRRLAPKRWKKSLKQLI